MTLRLIVLIAILSGAAHSPGDSGPCRVPSHTVESIAAELGRDNPNWGRPNTDRVTCVLARVGRDSVRVVAITGNDERTGGIGIVAASNDSVLYVYPYAGARDLSAVGNRRVMFTYTPIRELGGAGIYESDFIVLCAVERAMWLQCLRLPRDHVESVVATVQPMRFEEHNVASVSGDSLRYERHSVFWIAGVRDSIIQSLGAVSLVLPLLP